MSSRRAAISSLPDDVLLLIISYVDVQDILSLRKTSKRLFTMSKLRWVWYDAIKRHVVEEGLPVPAAAVADLKALTAEHLETRAVHAASFHENWNSAHPVVKNTLEFCAVNYLDDQLPDENRSAVTHVSFLPGRNGQYLITAVGRVLTCWEVPLGESEAYRVAEWVSAKKIEQVIVNEDPKAEVVVAYVSAHPVTQGVVECRALSFDKFHGRFYCRMELRAHRQVVMPLHLLHSDYLIFGDPMHVCFLTAPTIVKPIGKSSLAELPDNKVLTVKPLNRYLLVVRQRAFEVIIAPTWMGIRASYASLMKVCAHIELDIPASSAVVVARNSSFALADELPDWPAEPVTVLARHVDDGFELLYQYDLFPNPKAQASAKVLEAADCPPCIFPSLYTRVISVAPSCCDFRVGSSGKGFWTETRNITLRHARTPARCLVGFTVRPNPYEGKDPTRRTAHLQLCKDTLYARRCNIHEILWKKYMISSTALEDTVGRIAVGDVTGRVEVLDLA
ncbi:hypothetical protein K466DRAFT_515555 [Polyporus arcularius HHB13444]|uniref:F-box domain-containing protein n=1 Tax=Polyporus arcularius HHB13444 TaxID=1314778 RepID=A0A5C3PNT0_9APHY|nr:hypothetical protein K466DRAFT_515555 [Polyporus arcularius HHB13444]